MHNPSNTLRRFKTLLLVLTIIVSLSSCNGHSEELNDIDELTSLLYKMQSNTLTGVEEVTLYKVYGVTYLVDSRGLFVPCNK